LHRQQALLLIQLCSWVKFLNFKQGTNLAAFRYRQKFYYDFQMFANRCNPHGIRFLPMYEVFEFLTFIRPVA